MDYSNTITILRIPFLILILYFVSTSNPLAIFLIPILFFMDWLDGFTARRLEEDKKSGAVLDIAIDRLVEILLWVYLAYMKLVPIWVPGVIITRGILTDSIRNQFKGRPFDIMKGKLSRIVVSSHTSRGLYGFLKLFTFTFIIANHVLSMGLNFYVEIFVYLTVIYCVLRGLPVLCKIKDL
ncbi:MAG: CDP-alcohol phosphatidyltransferase family protein [Candidatus Aenigmatarchaeota archaeon]